VAGRVELTVVGSINLHLVALEHDVVSRGRLVAATYGAEGAALFEGGREVARATPPRVDAVDGTAAGALAASRLGAQPSLPAAAEVDAILAA
jgi:ribokinase